MEYSIKPKRFGRKENNPLPSKEDNWIIRDIMIPKKIHYCWFGGNKLPAKAKKCIDSWKKYCPDYEIILWDENNFDLTINRYVHEAYKAQKWAFVTDFVRLWVVYNYGGIYFDTDVEVVNPIDFLLREKSFFGIENTENKYINTGLGFGAEKGADILAELLEQYKDISFKIGEDTYDYTPCPDRNNEVFEKYGFNGIDESVILDGVKILSSEYMCPKNFATGKLQLTSNTISIHHYDGSWQPISMKFKSVVAKLIGYKNKKEEYK